MAPVVASQRKDSIISESGERRTSMITDIGNWVDKKMATIEDQGTSDDLDAETNIPTKLFYSSGSTRRSIEIREAVVQGTLISHLHAHHDYVVANVKFVWSWFGKFKNFVRILVICWLIII